MEKMKREANYLSYLSVLSAIAVVYLHANICFWTFAKERYWVSANVIESICFFAVPVFFMISGATLLDFYERYNMKTFFVKRIHKTLIPYLAWSVIGIIFSLILKDVAISDLSVKYVITAFLDGDAVDNVYWFFPALFCVYLAIPIMAAIPKSRKKQIYSYLIIVCFVLNILIPFLLRIFRVDYQFPLFLSVGSGYLFLVIAGYLLHQYELKPAFRYLLYVLGVLGLLAQIFGTKILSFQAGMIIDTYKGYVNVPCIFYSAAVFVLVKTIIQKLQGKGKIEKLDRVIARCSKYTLALYLIHWYFIRIMMRFLPIDERSIVFRLLAPIVAIALSVLLTMLLRKIPVIKRIVPE